jgi:hypothetical protein
MLPSNAVDYSRTGFVAMCCVRPNLVGRRTEPGRSHARFYIGALCDSAIKLAAPERGRSFYVRALIPAPSVFCASRTDTHNKAAGQEEPAALPWRLKQCRTPLGSVRIVGAIEPELHRFVSDCLEQGDGRSDRAIITPAPYRALIPIKVPCSIGKTEMALRVEC